MRRQAGPTHLYDLVEDPVEMNNLFTSADHEIVIDRLARMLVEHMRRTDEDWSIEAVFPPPDCQTFEQGREYARELLSRAIVEP